MDISELYSIYKKYPCVCTDTRKLVDRSLFFALKGENFDGNQFAIKALEKCKYAVVDDPEIANRDDRCIFVEDSLKALQELAKFHREQLSIPFIAITGTNGKTTTKELTAAVLEKKYKTFSTRGNYNNHIGVPISLLSIHDGHEIAIIEMGASETGDIKFLCDLAQPTHGLITNVGKAHLAGFGSFEQIMQAKGELYDYLYMSNGIAFVNYDNEYLEDMNPPRKTIHYGQSKFTHCQGMIERSELFLSFRWIATGDMVYDEDMLDWGVDERFITTKLIGSYNFENALAAVCIGDYFDVEELSIKEAIEAYEPSNLRSQYRESANNKLVIDTYNANPTSMRRSIEDFVMHRFPNKVLILGDMLELGKVSVREHDVLTHWIEQKTGIDEVYFVGGEFFEVKDKRFEHWFQSTDEFCAYLKDNPLKGKHILIKGSRGMELERCLQYL